MFLHQVDIGLYFTMQNDAKSIVIDAERGLLLHDNLENLTIPIKDCHLIVDEESFAQLLKVALQNMTQVRQAHQFRFFHAVKIVKTQY